MKKLTLLTKVIISTVSLSLLFFGGSYLAQTISESAIIRASKEAKEERAMAQAKKEYEEMDKLSLKVYYVDKNGFAEEVIKEFGEKYQLNPAVVTVSELKKDQEKYSYLIALTNYHEYIERPILVKNEKMITTKKGEKVVAQDPDGNYLRSLESILREINAISSKIDSEAAVSDICQNYGIDPNGLVEELTPEIILEIDQRLFEISDHPKN